MIKILMALIIGCGLAGCQTTNNYEIYKGKAPYIEGTSTKNRLIAIPDLEDFFISLSIFSSSEILLDMCLEGKILDKNF